MECMDVDMKTMKPSTSESIVTDTNTFSSSTSTSPTNTAVISKPEFTESDMDVKDINVKMEPKSENTPSPTSSISQLQNKPDPSILSAVIDILNQYNLKETENALKKEINLSEIATHDNLESDVSKILTSFKSEGEPAAYRRSYLSLTKFVEQSLDIYKHELSIILYPIFIHIYLELVYNEYEKVAIEFMQSFGPIQNVNYQEDIQKLSFITKKNQISGNDLVETLRANAFTIRMSRDTLSLLKRHLKEQDHSGLLNIIKKHLYFDVYEGVARNKNQIEITAGALVGEARRDDNKAKVYYGLLKEPDLQTFAPGEEDDDGEAGQDGDKPKKKKAKRDPLFNRKAKTDPNAPAIDRMPLPELRDSDKIEKVKALRESSKRISLGSETLPSVCCYTILNSYNTVCCAEISEDASMLAVGFHDSKVKIWSLTPQKLKAMKPAEQLQDLNLESDDIIARIMEDRAAETTRTLLGHNGPVFKVCFSPDRTLLLSCSADGTVRLWSLYLWTCLVVYKGHMFPVWDVDFSLHGYYFVTGGHEKVAKLWGTDSHQPLRTFVGHVADVTCVKFHPNSNYVATGSSDRTVRLFDCVTGLQVRLMTGHKGSVTVICFSMEGRFLVSAGTDYNIMVWDLSQGHLLAVFTGHESYINTLAFSRDGTILTSGSRDCLIKIWDFTRFTEDISFEDINVCHNPDIKKDGEHYLLRTFRTKESPVIKLFFSRRNVMFSICAFEPPAENQ